MKTAIFPVTKADILNPSLKNLFMLWDEKKAGKRYPNRKDFSFADFRPWLGFLIICSVNHETQEIYPDLVGTQVVAWDGEDMTHKIMHPTRPSNFPTKISQPFYATLENGQPMMAVHTKPDIGGKLERLILPCAADDNLIDKMISAILPNPPMADFLKTNSLLHLMS
ncbi:MULTISPECIES: PAS domain-containing protein [unclassified Iodidimonas]|jgi:hypothetical protein|uniref:PAS domain-containing protein n=1 Tax=unclassified Iodidimonas TaxID=2626145 RepID=UPI002482BB06|nr:MULTISPECIES: PAS domain-containing protein [unclassified Iodidimonas]